MPPLAHCCGLEMHPLHCAGVQLLQIAFISAAGGTELPIAGIWDEWKDTQTSEKIFRCTLMRMNSRGHS